jgi:hypothetical protein
MVARNGPERREARVLTCASLDCSYNDTQQCLAPGVAISGGSPGCETFTHDWVTPATPEPAIDSCKAAACYFNTHERCRAPGITISGGSHHRPECVTFRS